MVWSTMGCALLSFSHPLLDSGLHPKRYAMVVRGYANNTRSAGMTE